MSENNKPYESKSGFVLTRVLRGFTEIEFLHKFLLQPKLRGRAYICGGYVRYMCSPQRNPSPAGDVDIYCTEDKVFNAVRKVFDTKLKPKHENDISLTYEHHHNRNSWLHFCPTIQLIKPVREGRVVSDGQMTEVLENFDFTVVRAGLVSHDYATVDADFLHDEGRRILRLKNIHCPISSTLRCMKYSRKGYWLPPMQAVRLFMDWDDRDDEYRNKIIDYLQKANEGNGLSQKEVDELEALMRID